LNKNSYIAHRKTQNNNLKKQYMITRLRNIIRRAGVATLLSLIACFSTFAASKQMEYLDRGVVAIKATSGVFVSWRFLGTDKTTTTFNLYRDGTKVNSTPIATTTNYTDANGTTTSTYTVRSVDNNEESGDSKAASVWADIHKSIQLNRPAGGTDAGGTAYTYTPNDMSVGDLDGDGEYELVVKWDPSDSKDNSQSGYTGNVYIDAYKLNGTQLWRVDLGKNIRAGAHYTQFLVYDFDGDGKAEMVCRTAPGTIDGKGNYVLMGSDSKTADYRNSNGYILSGSEYLTVFNGETGANAATIAYEPARGNVGDWGDTYGNRVDRFLACVAYLDGIHPSIVESRGYYARAGMAAYDYKDGKLTKRWSRLDTSDGNGIFGEGFHNMSVADVDNDGYDEIIFGSACVDHDGSMYYRMGFGHGDAQHVSKMCATCTDYYGWFVHEETTSPYGYELRNLRTGKVIFGAATSSDNGRGMAADLSADNPGFEMWSTASGDKVFDINGKELSNVSIPKGVGGGYTINFRLYWNGDLQDEMLDRNLVITSAPGNVASRVVTMSDYGNSALINGSKYNPCLSADLLGDWREEFITYDSNDPSKINLFSTNTPTNYRIYTLMHDLVYREGVARENVAYNQPPHLGYYMGEGISDLKQPDIYVIQGGVAAPTLTKHGVGNSSQTVAIGDSIISFYYSWANANTVSVSGLPTTLKATIDKTAKTVTFSGKATENGTWNYSITTVSGYNPEAIKNGTFIFGTGKEVPDTATITTANKRNQTIIVGKEMTGITYTYTKADSLTLTGTLPDGVSANDNGNGTLTISGTPHTLGTYSYTLQTKGQNVNVTDNGGTLTVIADTTLSEMNITGALTQNIWEGDPMSIVTITYGAGTKSANVSGLPDGVTKSVNTSNKTITISGTPTASGVIKIESVGNGEQISYTLTLNMIASSLKKVAYITNPTAANYAKDTKILPALKACKDLYIEEVDASQSSFNFSRYDLVVVSEIPNSSDPLMASIKKADKPILNMKVFEYKTTENTWNWASTGYGDSYTATTISVSNNMLKHPMFKDVTYNNGNEIKMVDSVNTKALSYMYPAQFTSTSGEAISTIATLLDGDQPVIFEAPAGTIISGDTLSQKYIQIGLNSSSFANISTDGVSVVKNACYYLLGLLSGGSGVENVSATITNRASIHPNPVTDVSQITIFSAGGEGVMTLSNMAGQTVWNKTISLNAGNNTFRMEKGNLNTGVYTLTVNIEGEENFIKVIIK
jgi:hypothetical protein